MKQHGFTLIEMMVVLMLIGMSAAIMLPNLAYTLQRKKQIITMEQMDVIRNAIKDNWFNQCGTRVVPTTLTTADVPEMLGVPKDGWNRAFIYTKLSSNSYTLRSLGSDGIQNNIPNCWQTDIVITDGNFTQFPQGTQGDCP